jgi:hypothetical protein
VSTPPVIVRVCPTMVIAIPSLLKVVKEVRIIQ